MVAFNTRNPNYSGRPMPPQVKPSNEKELKVWRRQVAERATNAADGAFAPPHHPIVVRIEFRFAPPQTMPKERIGMTVSPDVDKLIRACLDGMTFDEETRTGIYADDKQVVEVQAWKRYATPLRPPGAYVEVEFSAGVEGAQEPLFAGLEI
jgi:Holliday junction resolvase RusA-like endonuclease